MRPFGLNYSKFIDGLAKAGVLVDRKVLSELAIAEPAAFQVIVEKAKAALPKAAESRLKRRPEGYLFAFASGGAEPCGMSRRALAPDRTP